jgi:hypothetical protein
MGCIHPDYIHASKKQLTKKINITSAIANGTNYLCFFHNFEKYGFYWILYYNNLSMPLVLLEV